MSDKSVCVEHPAPCYMWGNVQRERDELRSEVERLTLDNRKLTEMWNTDRETLTAEVKTWGRIWNDAEMLTARAEALRDGTADLGHHD